MSDTKPHQAAAEALRKLLNELFVTYAGQGTGDEINSAGTEAIRSIIEREARALADAELAAEREAIAVFVGERAQEYAWQDGPYYMGLANAYGKIAADVRCRTNSPSPLDPARSYIAALAAELDEARAQLVQTQQLFERTARDRDDWADAIRSVANGCIASPVAARTAISEMKAAWDECRTQIAAQNNELIDLAARVNNAESLVRFRDIEIDSLKATVNELQLIITSVNTKLENAYP